MIWEELGGEPWWSVEEDDPRESKHGREMNLENGIFVTHRSEEYEKFLLDFYFAVAFIHVCGKIMTNYQAVSLHVHRVMISTHTNFEKLKDYDAVSGLTILMQKQLGFLFFEIMELNNIVFI